jgi:hypothetical protein
MFIWSLSGPLFGFCLEIMYILCRERKKKKTDALNQVESMSLDFFSTVFNWTSSWKTSLNFPSFFFIFIVNEWLKMQTEEVVYWIQEFRARVNIYYPSASRLTRLILQSPHGLLCTVLLIIPRVEQGMVFQHLISDYFPLNAGTNLPAFLTIANSLIFENRDL